VNSRACLNDHGQAASGFSRATYLVPERKVIFRQNPNIETRNSKQIRIPNDKITKRNLLKFHCFGHWNISVFVIVSDFEIRISNFFTEKPGFSFRHYLRLFHFIGCRPIITFFTLSGATGAPTFIDPETGPCGEKRFFHRKQKNEMP
jgi:hypothetical protein